MNDPSSVPPPVTPVWTPPPPYAYGYPYQLPPPRKTNGLAIASLIVSIVGVVGMCGWGPLSVFVSPVGAILGHVAQRQIKTSGDQGYGMALAGIIVGWIGFVLALAYLALFIWLFTQGDSLFPPDTGYQDDF
ncbi:MAG TPA: DUF4190 domain-containing protein [Candidatus Limnocylindrales bacterium]|nr:DUF4190 domain-containing protein [Candidatus Limnocylindrales bacterium]